MQSLVGKVRAGQRQKSVLVIGKHYKETGKKSFVRAYEAVAACGKASVFFESCMT